MAANVSSFRATSINPFFAMPPCNLCSAVPSYQLLPFVNAHSPASSSLLPFLKPTSSVHASVPLLLQAWVSSLQRTWGATLLLMCGRALGQQPAPAPVPWGVSRE